MRYLATKLEQSPTKMEAAEIDEFLRLYRQTSADLARARAETSNPELIESLNSVLGIAYSALYRRPRKGVRQTAHTVLAAGAQAFRRQFIAILLSLLTTLGATFTAAGILHFRPDLRSYVISQEMEPLFEHWRKADFEKRTSGQNLLMSSFYASNNPRVAVTTSAIGASTLGVGSFFLLVMNGQMLGALSWDMARVGKLGFLLSSLAPHGASELSGMIVSGAAGYSLGWAVIAPGRRRRLDSLRDRGKDALVLLGMGTLMMYIAAPFEGFFSFNPGVPQWLKSIVGLLVFLGWCAYWAFYARNEPNALIEGLEMPDEEAMKAPAASRS
ncbi:MAG: stage II sporulation protein M [Chthonomonas sp.]|nr:stage II sporulation protein M [Chthonomonas sp.]